jgi:hypothetical protein
MVATAADRAISAVNVLTGPYEFEREAEAFS